MPSTQTIALFGEAEKGAFDAAHYCRDLAELVHYLGNPPPNSLGLFYAVQALLHDYDLLFFRVREEGFGVEDYVQGSRLLTEQQRPLQLAAVCAPGVGDREILDTIQPICFRYHSLLIVNQADMYDYLTA